MFMILRGCSEHARAADVNHLDGLLKRAIRICHRFFKRVEVYDDHVDWLDALLFELTHVVWVVAVCEDPGVDLGVERFDSPVHHLGKAGDLVDHCHWDVVFFEELGGSASRDDLDPELGVQSSGEFDNTGLVVDADECSFDLGVAHGGIVTPVPSSVIPPGFACEILTSRSPLSRVDRGSLRGYGREEMRPRPNNLWPTLRVAAATSLIVAVGTVGGCVSPEANRPSSVRTAADDRQASRSRQLREDARVVGLGADTGGVIATVNGNPIARSRVVELLLRAHGAGLLEQLIGLELAGQLAAEEGLSVNESDLESEYDLALRRLSDPLAMVTPDDFDRKPAERVLDSILDERNISREEFLMTIRRNAYLRKIVSLDLAVSEVALRAEYDRVYGERAEVRHIQLGSDGDAQRVMTRLAAGDDFDALANRFSANASSGQNGGLLEPFSKDDEGVPEEFRKIAFSLSPGEVSEVVKIGEWRHLIRLERIIPADERKLSAVRDELELQLRGRVAEEEMRGLFSRLMREANIDIRDPNVREAYTRRKQGQP